MSRTLFAAAAGALLASTAFAQTLIVEPQHRTVIREYVVQERVAPVEIREEIRVGATLPPTVELQPVPPIIYAEIPKARPYHYVLAQNQFVLVEPATRRVVQVIAVN